MNCSFPGSSVHGILQARIVEWVAMPSSRGSSQPRDRTHVPYVSCTGRWVLYHWCHLIWNLEGTVNLEVVTSVYVLFLAWWTILVFLWKDLFAGPTGCADVRQIPLHSLGDSLRTAKYWLKSGDGRETQPSQSKWCPRGSVTCLSSPSLCAAATVLNPSEFL